MATDQTDVSSGVHTHTHTRLHSLMDIHTHTHRHAANAKFTVHTGEKMKVVLMVQIAALDRKSVV